MRHLRIMRSLMLNIHRLLPVLVLLSGLLLLSTSVITAQEDAETTPEATPETTEEAAPAIIDYTLPPDPEDVDLDMVIGQVGDVDITLREFRDRVRYERFYYYYVMESIVGQAGEGALNLNDPQNQFGNFLNDLLLALANEEEFAGPIYDTMLLERLYHQEAEARDVVATDCDTNRYWALLMNRQQEFDQLQQTAAEGECPLPEGFEEDRTEFLNRATAFSGISEEAIQEFVLSRAEFDIVSDVIAEEVEVPDVAIARTRQIAVEDEATAQEVLERLQAGEDFQELLLEYSPDDPGAQGNAGNLGTFARGQMVPEFEEAAFAAEVGEVVGPVESQFGFHIIEVLDQTTSETVTARHILLESEEDANDAIAVLERGADFAELASTYSIDTGSAFSGGDLGEFGRGMMAPEFEEAAFNAEIGQVVGPVETQFGFHIIEVTDRGEEVSQVTARHILLESEEDAQATLTRLEEGEDFADLARELSIDPSAGGHRGDTRLLATGAQNPGFYAASEVASAIGDAVFAEDVEVGDVLGPISWRDRFVVIEVQELDTRGPDTAQIQAAQNAYLSQWQEDQLESDRVMQTDDWQVYIPAGLVPSDINPALAPLDDALQAAQEEVAALEEANSIPNILSNLEAPEPEEPETEAEASEDSDTDAEATQEATQEASN